MTRRSHAHSEDAYRPRDIGTDGLEMFAPAPEPTPAWKERWACLTDAERDAQRERWKEKLLPTVIRLAERAAGYGITASEVISVGISERTLNGERAFLTANPRVYSWVGAWLATLAANGVLSRKTVELPDGGTLQLTRKSDRKVSHANEGKIYLHPQVAA
jgi:hypothetical protein